METEGPLGRIAVKVSVSVTQNLLPSDDLMEPTPPQEKNLTSRWGWFHDDWYLIPPQLVGTHLNY